MSNLPWWQGRLSPNSDLNPNVDFNPNSNSGSLNDNYLRFFQFLVIISFKLDKRTKYILILICILISLEIMVGKLDNMFIVVYLWSIIVILLHTATWQVEVHHQHQAFLNLPKLPQDCSNKHRNNKCSN